MGQRRECRLGWVEILYFIFYENACGLEYKNEYF
jgi:hypothetical protein